jgi:hypothetical protein
MSEQSYHPQAADVYALGAVLTYMISEQRPPWGVPTGPRAHWVVQAPQKFSLTNTLTHRIRNLKLPAARVIAAALVRERNGRVDITELRKQFEELKPMALRLKQNQGN